MNTTIILLIAVAAALVGATIALALAFFRIRTREMKSLRQVAARLAESSALAARVPDLETRLGRLLANCTNPVLLTDESVRIVDLSARAEEDLDQPRRNRTLLETLESHELDEAARRAMATLQPAEITVRLYAQGRRPFRARLFPYRTGGGPECLIFLEDISAFVRYGELRSQFAATVSHELRTPLAGIRALVESLKDPGISREDAARFLERIDQETGRLGQLIDEILFLSSLESGVAGGLEGSTELVPLVEQVLEKLSPLARKFEVRLENLVPEGFLLPLNERMAATVISNLVENAVKYSGRGSKVEVAAEREDGRVRVTVRDNGIGIDAEHLPHIFERFYRVDKSRSRRLGGTGLGLSIVKHIVESAGGEIAAQSREGFGTEMSVILPLH